MSPRLLPQLLLCLGLLLAAAPVSAAPLRVHLRVGPSPYGPGVHDHFQFEKDFGALLRERGAQVSSSQEFPSQSQLEQTDVLLLYATNAGTIKGQERQRLEAWLERGGGIVALHDALGSEEPQWFKDVVGGAWEYGHSKEHEGVIGLYVADTRHPITRGVSNFDLEHDELYHQLHMAPGVRVLMTGFHTIFDITPQMWVYERKGHRAFVSLQGHRAETFDHQAWRTLLLRGIAWAGGRDVDLLTLPSEVAGLRYPAGGPLEPERAHEPIITHPDFELSLVAAEPRVVNPVSLDWDGDGRLWVALTPGYPEKAKDAGRNPMDQIVILTDSNGDGRMDRSRVFADDIDLVSSILIHGDGVIVASAPDLLWLRDTDGDGRADRREVLYTGFGHKDTHAVLSNLRWGLDGWIYASQGYSGQTSKITGKGDFGVINGAMIRMRPDGTAIENVLSASANTWGMTHGWDDEIFYSMANHSHVRHVVLPEPQLEDARVGHIDRWLEVMDHKQAFPAYQEQRQTYQQVDVIGGFTASAGNQIYDGGAWPDAYAGNHFVCEPTLNLVHRDLLREEGVSYLATKPREQEFLSSTDLWFRPVHLRVGPDGALYVLDFYNQAIVHNDSRGPEHGAGDASRRPDRDRMHGRIWRLQHKRARRFEPPRLASANGAQLVAALSHRNGWRRRAAHRLLIERGPTALVELQRLAGEGAPAPRVHALWLLELWGRLDGALLTRALGAGDVGVRANAWRIAGLREGEAPAAWLQAFAAEQHPRVRVRALAAVGPRLTASPEGARQVLATAAKLGDDFSQTALLHAFVPRPQLLIAHGLAQSDSGFWGPLMEEAGKLLGHNRDPEQLRAMLEAAAAAGSAPLAELALSATLDEWPPDQLPRGLPGVDPALRRLLREPDSALARAGLPFAARLAVDTELQSIVDGMISGHFGILNNSSSGLRRRLGSLRALVALPEHRAEAIHAARALLGGNAPQDVQQAVVAELGKVDEPVVGEVLTVAFGELTPSVREEAFQLLMQRPEWTITLLNAVADERIGRRTLGAERAVLLRNHPDQAVARRAGRVFDALGGSAEPREADARIAELLPLVDRPGNPANGRLVYEQHCGSCHAFRGAGGDLAPDLTGMGAHTTAALLPSIVDPNRLVEPAYHLHVAQTADGRTLMGVLAQDSPSSVVLRHTSGDLVVAREELVKLESTGRSLMPEGLDETIGADGLRDLLSYLRAGYEGYRVLDLEPLFTSSTWHGLYDQRSPTQMEFLRYGAVDVRGVPFVVLDPTTSQSGLNALVLRGGMRDDWESKRRMPLRVEVPLGYELERVHVLGGVAAWGHPYTDSKSPAVRWTWHYADGTSEERILTDGVEFADWIRRIDVPGSRWVNGLLKPESPGQLRYFHLEPGRPGQPIEKLTLESFDNHLAPTFLSLTAELPGAPLGEELAAGLERLRELLASDEGRRQVLELGPELVAAATEPSVQLSLVDALVELDDPLAAELLSQAYPGLAPAPRERAFQALVERPAWAHRLLNALATGRVPASALGSDRRARLLHHEDPTLAHRSQAVLATAAGPAEEPTEALIAELIDSLGQAADLEHGAELYRTQCAACHEYGGEGTRFGPPLELLVAQGPRRLVRAMVDARRPVPEAMLSWTALTMDGRSVEGALVDEAMDRVMLRNASGVQEVARAELASLSASNRSVMPSDYAERLGAEGVRDLVAWLTRELGDDHRVLDIASAYTASTAAGLYEPELAPEPLELEQHGLVRLEDGVPFALPLPDDTASGFNALVLKGGMNEAWASKRRMPQRVEIPVGMPLHRVHVLGGIAAWGFPFTKDKSLAVSWTWRYADGREERVELRDGEVFADWIARHEVPRSEYVPGLVASGAKGQLRRFHVDPRRHDVAIDTIVLESPDSHLAPTFLALTAQLSEPADVRLRRYLLLAAAVLLLPAGLALWLRRRRRGRRR